MSYTVTMSSIANVQSPIVPKTKNVRPIALLLAGILGVFVVAQLFGFDEFQLLVQSFWLPGGKPFAYFLSGFIVVAEVFALPFLLNMRISTLLRILSMILTWIVPAIWLTLSLWLQLTTNAVTNIGFLGTHIVLMPGWWTVLFSIALAMLAAWASWGMWPWGHSHKK